MDWIEPAGGGAGGDGGTLCGNPFGDDAGSATPATDIDASGGIVSAETFDEWFAETLGDTMSLPYTVELVDNGVGVYECLSDASYPIDDEGLGNAGQLHNHYFTLELEAEFTYEACGGQFIEFEGSDDAWLYVDGELVMDLGGIGNSTTQLFAMDRLGLVEDGVYEVKFFHAQRQSNAAVFRLRTNISLRAHGQTMVSKPFD